MNGRKEEARQVLAEIARGNGTVMPKGELKDAGGDVSSAGDLGTISLFRGSVIRRRTLIVCVMW